MKYSGSLKMTFTVAALLAVVIPAIFLIIPVTGYGSSVSASGITSVAPFVSSSVSTVQPTSVSVQGVFSYEIVQQPARNPGFVSSESDKITQFGLATKFGSTGLLAHNYLVGKEFFNVSVGDLVEIAYTDGKTKTYIVKEIQRYQALQPNSPYSDFVDLNPSNNVSQKSKPQLTATQLFNRVYAVKGRVIFQTCITANGNDSWGRLFIVAVSVTQLVSR